MCICFGRFSLNKKSLTASNQRKETRVPNENLHEIINNSSFILVLIQS
jgi:hypothetical protein